MYRKTATEPKKSIRMSTPVERIVSLLPGATEIVCALGLGGKLVGRSHECDFPKEVEKLPIVSKPRLDPSAAARDIDKSVRTLVEQGLSVFEVDAELLQSLKPDAIVTQVQCDVCAVSEQDVLCAVSEWVSGTPKVVSTSASSLRAVLNDIKSVARALDAETIAHEVVMRLENRLDELRALTSTAESRPSVLSIEWTDPLMSSGNWMPELIDIAGGRSLLAERDAHSPWIEWDEVREADPDVLVVSPCGFDLARATASIEDLQTAPGWDELNAVRKQQVYAVDGHQFFHRPGPRLVESTEILAAILQPRLSRPLAPRVEAAFRKIV